MMGHLSVVSFGGQHTADDVLVRLRRLEQDWEMDIEKTRQKVLDLIKEE